MRSPSISRTSDRHAQPFGRHASAAVLVGLGLAMGLGIFLADRPARIEPGGLEPSAMTIERSSSAQTSARCVPHDAALGNIGGDPYGYYAFTRDEELARLRASCDGEPAGASTSVRADASKF